MNEEQRTITELKKRITELEEKVSVFENPTRRSSLMLGRAARPNPESCIGLIEYWSGKKMNRRHFPW
jgi:hypothetical protein